MQNRWQGWSGDHDAVSTSGDGKWIPLAQIWLDISTPAVTGTVKHSTAAPDSPERSAAALCWCGRSQCCQTYVCIEWRGECFRAGAIGGRCAGRPSECCKFRLRFWAVILLYNTITKTWWAKTSSLSSHRRSRRLQLPTTSQLIHVHM